MKIDYPLDILAELYHKKWSEQQLQKGLHHPSSCPSPTGLDQTCAFCDPLLVPYGLLTSGAQRIIISRIQIILDIIEELNKASL